jgi:hypothetical protein
MNTAFEETSNGSPPQILTEILRMKSFWVDWKYKCLKSPYKKLFNPLSSISFQVDTARIRKRQSLVCGSFINVTKSTEHQTT